jgi:hypothetical protein
MYINVEIPRASNAESLNKITSALNTEPFLHESMSCGYNTINVSYQCSKNDYIKIKNHWKSIIPHCLVVAI